MQFHLYDQETPTRRQHDIPSYSFPSLGVGTAAHQAQKNFGKISDLAKPR